MMIDSILQDQKLNKKKLNVKFKDQDEIIDMSCNTKSRVKFKDQDEIIDMKCDDDAKDDQASTAATIIKYRCCRTRIPTPFFNPISIK